MTTDQRTIVEFEDCGQDFLWWEIDRDGRVVDCGPFQAWLWVGMRYAPASLRVGRRPRCVGGPHHDFVGRRLNYRVVARRPAEPVAA